MTNRPGNKRDHVKSTRVRTDHLWVTPARDHVDYYKGGLVVEARPVVVKWYIFVRPTEENARPAHRGWMRCSLGFSVESDAREVLEMRRANGTGAYEFMVARAAV